MPHDHPHHHSHRPRAGDNRAPKSATQWQAPTGPEAPPVADPLVGGPPEPDFDLVETAFCEAALTAKDATSLLRLARVPFIAELENGAKIYLLTFRVEQSVEVGSIAPGFAADQPVYHPLPESRLRREKRAKLIYQTPDGLREYSLGDVRRLRDVTLAAETQG
jgi:hypothetical protein